MKYYNILFLLVLLVMCMYGGESNTNSSSTISLFQKIIQDDEVSRQKFLLDDGTRLIIYEFFVDAPLMPWIFDSKGIQKYQNGNIIRYGRNNTIVDYKFDDQNKIIESQQFDGSTKTWKITYSYSPDGTPLGFFQLYWSDDHFDTLFQDIYTTDDNGFILQALTQQYSNGQWSDVNRSTYTRDTSGNSLTRLREFWNGSNWLLQIYDSSIYINNKVVEIVTKSFFSGIGEWRNSSRRIYTYDDNGDNAQTVHYTWIENLWRNYARETYTTKTDPNIILLYPNIYKEFTTTDPVKISWTSSEVATVNIELSTDNGSSWTTLAGGRTDSSFGFYTYQNSTINSNQCLIRISDASNPAIYDQSTMPFMLSSQVSMLMHETGSVQLSVFNTGDFGNSNGPMNGAGFNFHGSNNPLFTAGVLLGTSSTGLYGKFYSFFINDLSTEIGLHGFASKDDFDQISAATYGFAPTFPAPINQLSFKQSSYSKPGSDYVYIIVSIDNNSTTTAINDLYVGLAADWDIGNYATNLGGIVQNKNLVYQYNKDGVADANYYGIVSLNNFVGAKVTSEFFNSSSRQTGFPWVSTLAIDSITTPNDYRSYIGSGPYNIPAQSTVQIGFAFVGASSLSVLQLKADTLLSTWQSGVLDVKQFENILPKKYSLYQNYPNPFNPTTIIKYDLPKDSKVKIIVFDMLGRKVGTLVDEGKSSGSYEVEFNANNLSSGIYFYQLQTEEFTQTKKLILMK